MHIARRTITVCAALPAAASSSWPASETGLPNCRRSGEDRVAIAIWWGEIWKTSDRDTPPPPPMPGGTVVYLSLAISPGFLDDPDTLCPLGEEERAFTLKFPDDEKRSACASTSAAKPSSTSALAPSPDSTSAPRLPTYARDGALRTALDGAGHGKAPVMVEGETARARTLVSAGVRCPLCPPATFELLRRDGMSRWAKSGPRAARVSFDCHVVCDG